MYKIKDLLTQAIPIAKEGKESTRTNTFPVPYQLS